jgi:hypothetical protein
MKMDFLQAIMCCGLLVRELFTSVRFIMQVRKTLKDEYLRVVIDTQEKVNRTPQIKNIAASECTHGFSALLNFAIKTTMVNIFYGSGATARILVFATQVITTKVNPTQVLVVWISDLLYYGYKIITMIESVNVQ